MGPRLKELIQLYQQKVASAVELLAAAGIPRPSSNLDWATAGHPRSGTIGSGERYRRHGYGCAFTFSDGSEVDFDFGDTGQIDGVEPYRLWRLAAAQPDQYGFGSREELLAVFDRLVSSGVFYLSKDGLYYLRATTMT